MGDILIKILVCFIAGAGAGIGTGFAGMSAAAVIGPMLITFLGIPAYDAVGVGLIRRIGKPCQRIHLQKRRQLRR